MMLPIIKTNNLHSRCFYYIFQHPKQNSFSHVSIPSSYTVTVAAAAASVQAYSLSIYIYILTTKNEMMELTLCFYIYENIGYIFVWYSIDVSYHSNIYIYGICIEWVRVRILEARLYQKLDL